MTTDQELQAKADNAHHEWTNDPFYTPQPPYASAEVVLAMVEENRLTTAAAAMLAPDTPGA